MSQKELYCTKPKMKLNMNMLPDCIEKSPATLQEAEKSLPNDDGMIKYQYSSYQPSGKKII